MISCHIASLPERSESLKKTIISIYHQVDKVYVALNGYIDIPIWLVNLQHANYELLDNSLGDGAKWLHCWDEPAICFLLDDDLSVSNGVNMRQPWQQNYVLYMLEGLKRYGGAVSLHGKNYANRPVVRYRRNYTANYRCLNTVANDTRVDVIGTGCMVFDNTQIKFDQSLYEHKNMADVLFSRLCHQQGIQMTVLKHNRGYLQYTPPKVRIWRMTTDDRIQTEIINSFLK
jgi:hypothetical protein